MRWPRRSRKGRAQDGSLPDPEAFEKSWLNARSCCRRATSALVQEGQDGGSGDDRRRAVAAAQLGVTSRPGRCTTTRPTTALQPASGFRPLRTQARWPAELRPPSSVFVSNTNHEENQPAHLTLKDATVPVRINPRSWRAREPLPSRGRVRIRAERRRRRPAADQRAELRALQDLRHQGPHAEHRLGDARAAADRTTPACDPRRAPSPVSTPIHPGANFHGRPPSSRNTTTSR